MEGYLEAITGSGNLRRRSVPLSSEVQTVVDRHLQSIGLEGHMQSPGRHVTREKKQFGRVSPSQEENRRPSSSGSSHEAGKMPALGSKHDMPEHESHGSFHRLVPGFSQSKEYNSRLRGTGFWWDESLDDQVLLADEESEMHPTLEDVRTSAAWEDVLAGLRRAGLSSVARDAPREGSMQKARRDRPTDKKSTEPTQRWERTSSIGGNVDDSQGGLSTGSTPVKQLFASPSPPRAQQQQHASASEWRSANTPDGRVYYYHRKTRESVWTLPPNVDPRLVKHRGQFGDDSCGHDGSLEKALSVDAHAAEKSRDMSFEQEMRAVVNATMESSAEERDEPAGEDRRSPPPTRIPAPRSLHRYVHPRTDPQDRRRSRLRRSVSAKGRCVDAGESRTTTDPRTPSLRQRQQQRRSHPRSKAAPTPTAPIHPITATPQPRRRHDRTAPLRAQSAPRHSRAAARRTPTSAPSKPLPHVPFARTRRLMQRRRLDGAVDTVGVVAGKSSHAHSRTATAPTGISRSRSRSRRLLGTDPSRTLESSRGEGSDSAVESLGGGSDRGSEGEEVWMGDREQCSSCGRWFAAGRLEPHARVCKSVFLTKRPVFSSKERRMRR